MCVTVKTSEFMTAQVKLVVMNSNVFTVPNYSCDCACNLCDILSGTYKFCNLYMYLNTTQFPVGFFLFKKPSACLYKPTTGADHPQSVPIGLVTIFTTNSMGFTSTPDKITLYMPRYMHKHLVQIYMYCRHVLVHVQSKFYLVWMHLVVNIVTCPIGTDCGGSAPVVGLYGQQRAFCPTGNY